MLWESYQQSKIHGAEFNADKAVGKAERAVDEITRLQRRIDRLNLNCQAMWELLRDRCGMTDQELESKILEVDLRDGSKDGKMSLQTCICQACGRSTNSRRQTCLMCGAELAKAHVFDG